MIRLLAENELFIINELGALYDSNFAHKYNNSNNRVFVYEQDSKILGFLMIEDTIDESNIILLYVKKENRRQKIASSLLNRFINDESTNKKIFLEVSAKNEPALALYKKYGFNQINIRPKYYKDGSNAIVMERG